MSTDFAGTGGSSAPGDRERTASRADALVFLPDPGACGGRLDPGQTLVPTALISVFDFHVWPSTSPWSISPMARTVCEHVDYRLLHYNHPELFDRRQQHGAPALQQFWDARQLLAELGFELCLDVQLENVDGELALVVYGAGVVGRLTDIAWSQVAGLLTTDASMVIEPAPETVGLRHLVRPARPATSRGKRALPTRVTPLGWQVGDWVHTWWSYPLAFAPDTRRVPELSALLPGTRAIA